MKSRIASAIDEAVKTSGELSDVIKDFKKYLMRQFLGLGNDVDPTEMYRSGFSKCEYKKARFREIVQSGGIVTGASDETFYKELYNDSGYQLIVPLHINSLRFRPEKLRYISRKEAGKHQQFIIKGGDIILSHSGNDIGASALIPFMQEDSFLGPGLFRIRLNHNLCEVFYVLNILHFYYHTDILKMILGETGGLNVDTVSNMIIPLPPVQNQKWIAEQMLRLSGGMELQEHYHKEMLKFNLFIDNL